MTYARDWRSYPPSFNALIERAALQEVRIPCKDAKDAKRLEGKLHAYFGVLHKSVIKDLELIPLDNLSRRVRVKAEGDVLVAMPRDQEPDNELILRALAQTSSSATDKGDVPMSPVMRELFAKTLTTDK